MERRGGVRGPHAPLSLSKRKTRECLVFFALAPTQLCRCTADQKLTATPGDPPPTPHPPPTMLASPKRPPPPSLFEPATPDRAAAAAEAPPPSPPPLAVTTIDALSDDLLRHVFSFTGLLDSVVTVRRVCPRWRDAASPPTGRGALDAVVVAREPRIAARVSSAGCGWCVCVHRRRGV